MHKVNAAGGPARAAPRLPPPCLPLSVCRRFAAGRRRAHVALPSPFPLSPVFYLSRRVLSAPTLLHCNTSTERGEGGGCWAAERRRRQPSSFCSRPRMPPFDALASLCTVTTFPLLSRHLVLIALQTSFQPWISCPPAMLPKLRWSWEQKLLSWCCASRLRLLPPRHRWPTSSSQTTAASPACLLGLMRWRRHRRAGRPCRGVSAAGVQACSSSNGPPLTHLHYAGQPPHAAADFGDLHPDKALQPGGARRARPTLPGRARRPAIGACKGLHRSTRSWPPCLLAPARQSWRWWSQSWPHWPPAARAPRCWLDRCVSVWVRGQTGA